MTIQEKQFLMALKGSRKYFNKHHEKVLNTIYDHHIESYSEWDLDMIKKSEADKHCDCDTLENSEDTDLLKEVRSRGLILDSNNIITDSLINRFINILSVGNPLKIQTIIEQLEKDNNII